MSRFVDNGELFGPEGGNVALCRPSGWTRKQWAQVPVFYKAELLAFCVKAVNDFFERGVSSPSAETARQGTQRAGAAPPDAR